MKLCNIGTLTYSKLKNPEIYYSIDNQVLTQELLLTNGNKAYFTAAHAMGDFWPTRLEWRDGIWLLQLTWCTPHGDDERSLITHIANQLSK
jgi:hypothetical protein